jgi:hypothetical protein
MNGKRGGDIEQSQQEQENKKVKEKQGIGKRARAQFFFVKQTPVV